ncbi:hypothetical protein ASPCAL07191 [Aspergillus calidoustus]|uniref:Copper-fist domain-containing protein n=1 Tax=Aspergillus calidoustus TaxID=454130 RepID=A0A0U5G2I4_ASPCI|nr:hypothetical protein ASPCAL07191 [Aspergillus calidoustus]
MPLDEHGNKWSCESCLRGHRSAKCKHFDRVMVKVPKSGRPLKQCPHGRLQDCGCRKTCAIMTRLSSDSQNLCRPLYYVGDQHEHHSSGIMGEDTTNVRSPATPAASRNRSVDPPISTPTFLPPPHHILPTQLPRLAQWPLPPMLDTPSPPGHISMSTDTSIQALETHLQAGEYAILERLYSIGPPAIGDLWSPSLQIIEEPIETPHDLSLAAHHAALDLLNLGMPFPLVAQAHTFPSSETGSII